MDVAGWLRSLGLDQYEANFRENKIDADVPRLTADDLRDIGLRVGVHLGEVVEEENGNLIGAARAPEQ